MASRAEVTSNHTYVRTEFGGSQPEVEDARQNCSNHVCSLRSSQPFPTPATGKPNRITTFIRLGEASLPVTR